MKMSKYISDMPLLITPFIKFTYSLLFHWNKHTQKHQYNNGNDFTYGCVICFSLRSVSQPQKCRVVWHSLKKRSKHTPTLHP